MKLVFSTSNGGELAFIKSLLMAEGIRFFNRGERVNAWLPGPAISHYNQVYVFVTEDDYQKAKEIIEEYHQKVTRSTTEYRFIHKLRMMVECALMVWFVPGQRPTKHE